MIKSLCIKTNNLKIINELINEIEKIDMENIFISQKTFSFYENLIIHYTGNNINEFIVQISNCLTDIIINYYQKMLLHKIINENYFYFFEHERNEIIELCLDELDNIDYIEQYKLISNECIKYFNENKSLVIDGFVRFRLYKYIKKLDEIVESGINRYLVNKEYLEFIRLLKEYILSSTPNNIKIHLIYSKNNVILLNEENQIIPIENNLSNSKFLSDISFSKNDYCLNTLLSLLPQKITMHLLLPEDDFIETLKQIFSDRISICTSCELCLKHQNISHQT